jgi:hypothetical protein
MSSVGLFVPRIHHSSFIIHHLSLSFIIYHSSFIIHHLSFIIHFNNLDRLDLTNKTLAMETNAFHEPQKDEEV